MAARAAKADRRRKRPLDLDPGRVRDSRGRHFAVVDIGSNSVRLVVYDTLSRAPFPRFNEKSFCGLGEGLAATGRLSEASMREAVEAIHRHAAIARAMEAGRIDLLATEAVRSAANGADFVEVVSERTGLPVRVLSGAEEARLSALGVISGFYRPRGLVGDIGGGSLEIAEVLDDVVGERRASLPLGALPVRALLAEHGREARRHVDAILKDTLPPQLTEPVFYAVGGGWRALARVHMETSAAPLRVVHGYTVASGELRDLAKRIWRLPAAEVAALPGAPRGRHATLPAAALVMDRVLKRLAPERVVLSALGLREGWLYAQLPVAEQYRDGLVEGAQAFGVPRARVAAFGAALARWTDDLFAGEVPTEKRLRLAVCAVSDIAWVDHADVQARDSFDRLIQFPFIGLDHAERAFIASAIHARYDGKAADPVLQPALSLLSPAQMRRAQILGRAILVGYRLSGSVPEILDDARLVIDADAVRLRVVNEDCAPDSEGVRYRLGQLAKAVGVARAEIVSDA
jgi:exopolyphosphatase/guanosine-5'-triphosphate,3'-diphosphate pyrophosphatase